MSLFTRNIYTPAGHGLSLPNGHTGTGIEIRFVLVQSGTLRMVSPFDAITKDRIQPVSTVITDSNGEFTISLWPTDRGAGAYEYVCHIRNGQTDFRAALPSGAPITWGAFMMSGTPLS